MSSDVRKTVLVVDDTPENLDVLKNILSNDYRLQVATNGRLALKIAFSPSPPDLILLDVMMPGMDGHEVCRLLKADKRTSDIPILFVTARVDVEDETLGFSLGAVDYLTKPISVPIVLARVKTHLAFSDKRKLLADQVDLRTTQLRLQTMELEKTRLEVIRQLGRAAEFRDNETGQHVIRMSHFVKFLALKIGLSEPESEQLMNASMMHDLGKIGIPDQVLLKPSKLTEEEFGIIKTHPEVGYRIIGEQPSGLLSMARTIAYTHHEKWNGSGYPQGLQGQEIPLEGRITAIADVFDALTSTRPYKKAWSVDDTMDLIRRESCEHFDPDLVKPFIDLRPQILQIMDQHQD
ncbi:MAG: two-component system response regulator [Magnetococcales bacterium]|nr:two-component system response regulator [Magnetococcales bacterium]MBF0322267.1 two-component system response regulator [Magnetococcales bacterium]